MFADANAGRGNYLNLAVFVGTELGSKCGFARWHGFVEVSMEFAPNSTIQSTCTFEALDTTCLQSRIKRSQIAKLHRETVRRPTKFFRDRNNHWLTGVKLPEAQFVIKVKR